MDLFIGNYFWQLEERTEFKILIEKDVAVNG
jgi:hypothetical protein